jgi:outer membrane lipoprotein-sorting protein
MVNKMKKLLITLAICALSANTAAANKTAEEVLSADTPEAKGIAIMTELDDRDFGFGDMEVDLDMTLRNAHGQEIIRQQRNKTLEVTDIDQGDKSLIIFDNPRDVKGTAFLTFSKIIDPDDQWLYLPALKRVKRISSKNKSGPFVGSEFAYEDISSQEVAKYTYKYLHNEACGDIECFVIERYPAYKHSGYTKQIIWVDTKEFRPIKIDFYDRKSELLKTLAYEDYQQYIGQYWRADRFMMQNHQNGKSTEIVWKNYRFKVGLAESDFTHANLKRVR